MIYRRETQLFKIQTHKFVTLTANSITNACDVYNAFQLICTNKMYENICHHFANSNKTKVLMYTRSSSSFVSVQFTHFSASNIKRLKAARKLQLLQVRESERKP